MKRNILQALTAFLMTLFLIITSTEFVLAGNGRATSSGNWNDPSSWLINGTARIPTCRDTVLIPSGLTITINTQQTYTCGAPLYITVSGVLRFTTGNKLTLPCGSVVNVTNGGTIVPGNGGGNSNLIEICNTVVWTSGAGTVAGPLVFQVSPLPIELIHFMARPSDFSVILEWATATEINNDYFTLERSLDSKEWTTIGQVSGAGNSSSILEYSFVDQQPINDVSYYRLKQTDFDGKFSYSDPVAVSMNRALKNTLLTASLDASGVNVTYLSAEGGNADLIIHTMSGAEVFRQTVQVEKGFNVLHLSLPSLSSGLHFVTVEYGNDRQSKKAARY